MNPNAPNSPLLAAPPPKIESWRWWIIWLLFFATVVNYMDRQTLTSASFYIIEEFHLTNEQYGEVEAWFGLSYAIFIIVAGFLADRVSLRWLYAGALLLWSAAGFATGLAKDLITLKSCRCVLGIGESFNWPCAVGVIPRVLPREARSLANGVFNSGMTLGAIVTPLLVVAMVGPSGEGWRTLFMVVGAAGSLWVAAWLASTRGEAAREMARPPPEEGPSTETPLWSVFFARQFWITAAVGIAVNICWHFYRVWLPLLMKDDMKINPETIQYLIAGFYLVADIGSIATGYAIGRLTRRGRPLERVRKIVLFWTAGLCLLGTFVALSPGTMVMVPLIFLVGAGIMGVFAIFYSLVQDICPAHTSKCLGLIGSGAWFINAYLHVRVGRLADHIQTPFGKFAPVLIAVGFLPLLVAFLALAWPKAPSSRGSYS